MSPEPLRHPPIDPPVLGFEAIGVQPGATVPPGRCHAPADQGHGLTCGAVPEAHDYLGHDFVSAAEAVEERFDAEHADAPVQSFPTEPVLLPMMEMPTLSTGPLLVLLGETCAVNPEAVSALVEREYRVNGEPHYAVDVVVAGARAPIVLEDVRLAEILALLNEGAP